MVKKKLDLSGLFTGIHIVFLLSIGCFGVMYLSLGILALPALTSAFTAGRELLFGRYDVYDGVMKSFFATLGSEMRMMRYFPIQLIILLQCAGMYAAKNTGMDFLFLPMLVCVSLLLTFTVYLIAYRVFCEDRPRLADVVIAMLYRVQYFLIIWVLMILAAVFFGTVFMGITFLMGAVLIFALEITAYLGLLAFKRISGKLTDEEKDRFGEDILNKI